MAEVRRQGVRQRRVRESRIGRWAFLVSVVLHALVFLFGPRGSVPISSLAAAGPDRADFRAADGNMTVLALSSAPPTPIRRPALPVVDVELAVPQLNTMEPLPEAVLNLPDLLASGIGSTSGRDPGDASDAGIPGAIGAGDAGTSIEGRFRIVPPSPRGIILPPTSEDLRGSRIEVWVFVDEGGRVVADSTRLEPPTENGRFNEQLLGEAAQWVFEPARQNGAPVAAWFPYTISME